MNSAQSIAYMNITNKPTSSYAIASFCTYLLSPDFHIACRLCLPLLADHEATPFSSAHGHEPVSLLQEFIVDRARTVETDWCRLPLTSYSYKTCPCRVTYTQSVCSRLGFEKNRNASNATYQVQIGRVCVRASQHETLLKKYIYIWRRKLPMGLFCVFWCPHRRSSSGVSIHALVEYDRLSG